MKKFWIDFVQGGMATGETILAHDSDDACRILCKKHPDCEIIGIDVLGFVTEEPADTYRDAIVALIDRQRAKGLSKYGQTLEENTTLTTEQRIEHAQEELVDALQYLEHLKQAKTDKLTANDYQRAALRTASEENQDKFDGNGPLLDAALGLGGEAGECLDIVKKHLFQGHELDLQGLLEELGDVAWYLAIFCDALGFTLETVMQMNIDKLRKRYPDGFDKARSINREEAQA